MKKLGIAALLLFWATTAGFGQGRDSAFAVHKLFEQKRKSSKSTKELAGEMTKSDKLREAVVGTALAVTPFLIGTSQAERYSLEREADILRRHAQGQPLPAAVRQRLRRKHFHVTAQDVLAMRR